MNNITQIKRGSTTSWSLGPEMVQWQNLGVWGKDSLVHCEGTDLEMNVYTASANYFYDENGQLENVKRPGLWLIQPGEINWSMAGQVEFKCWTSGPSDCWLEVAAPNAPPVHGQRIPLGQQARMTVPHIGEWGLYIRWPEQRESVDTANIKISIRQVDAYEELAPGQLGLEYTEDDKIRLKAGKPGVTKWNELPYVTTADTDLAPDYGDNILPIGRFEPFYHLEEPEATNLIITQQDGIFRMNGTLQRSTSITPVYKQQSTGKVDLKAGKTYYLNISRVDERGALTNLKNVWVGFFDGESISSEDFFEGYTPQENKEIERVSITLSAFSIGNPVEIQNELFSIYLGERESYSFEGRSNKALMPQDQLYSKNHQAQMRKNIGAQGEKYIITLDGDDNGWFTKTTWTELVDAYQGGKEVVVTDGVFLMTSLFPYNNPGIDKEFYVSVNYGGEFVDATLKEGLNDTIYVVYSHTPLTISINGVESDKYGPTDFTEVINEMIEAKIAAIREEAYQAGYAQGKAEGGQEG